MHSLRNHHHHHHHQHHMHNPMWQTQVNLNKGDSNINTVMPTTEEEEQNVSDDAESCKAYFTTIPPPEPQRLVLMGEMPESIQMPEKMQQLLGNILAIEYEGFEYQPRHSPDRSTAETQKSEDRATRTNKRRSRKMRQLLHQLINNLPIFNPALCSDTLVSPGLIHQSRAMQSSRCGSKISSPIKHRSVCSIAVQARNTSPDQCSDIVDLDKDDWMGGVRALRDSHVRLVQRQLRHIERLNRALDRVTRTSPTKNTVKQVRV